MIGCLQSVLLFEYVSIGTCGRAHIGASRRYVQMRSLLRHANEAKLLRNSSRFSNVPTWNLWGGGGGNTQQSFLWLALDNIDWSQIGHLMNFTQRIISIMERDWNVEWG